MSLLAYHLAHHWLRASDLPSKLKKLPTPFQYFLTMDFINYSTPFSLLRSLGYAIQPSSAFNDQQRSSLHRATLSWMLISSFSGFLIIMSLIWSIQVMDVILHNQILFVQQDITVPLNDFKAAATMVKGCEDPIFNTCGVLNRSVRASTAGANMSEDFRVYETRDRSRGSMAFMGPTEPLVRLKIDSAHTYATGTVCEAFHPHCIVKHQRILNCLAIQSPHGIGQWNQLVYNAGFNTTFWERRLQSFIPFHGHMPDPNLKPLTNGATLNPFTTVSFGCFPNYTNIEYNNTGP